MSHANGQIIIGDKVVGHFEYNGTVDVAISHIYDSYEEMDKNWRSGRWLHCTCRQEPVDAYIWTDYGGGFYWEGKVCMTCRAILTQEPTYTTYDEDEDEDYSNCGYGDPRRAIYHYPIDGYPLDSEPYPQD